MMFNILPNSKQNLLSAGTKREYFKLNMEKILLLFCLQFSKSFPFYNIDHI